MRSKADISARIDELMAEIASEKVANAQEVMEYLTSVLRGESKSSVLARDEIGAERVIEKPPDEKERLKAAELLGKRYGLYTDKVDLDADAERISALITGMVPDEDFRPDEPLLPGSRPQHKTIHHHEGQCRLWQERGHCPALYPAADADPGRNLVCIRKSDITNRDSTYAELTGAIYRMFGDRYGRYWKINASPLSLECLVNGNQIIFRGVNDERQREKLKSITFKRGKLTDVWDEEATEITQQDFEIIDDRLRGALPEGQFYQIRCAFNPVSSQHWIKRVFFDIQDPNVLTHHSTYLHNPLH